MSALIAIASLVVDGDVSQREVVGLDAEDVHWRVLDVETGDAGRVEVVEADELRLLLAAVSAFSVPPASAIAVQQVASGAFDSDLLSGDRDEWAFPLLVVECGLALEDNLRHVGKSVSSSASGKVIR